ncbi:MAG: glycosyltransferase family 39 protein [Candidatus Azambacteria bacterium]|nr:glycosyltransferase family 39 protein [Candidatus Azambacteria bacterium]
MIEKFSKRKIEIFGLAIILLSAGFFYFYNITQKGFFTHDEAWFSLTGNTYAAIPKILVSHILNPQISIEDLTLKYLPGHILFGTSVRPLFIFINALGILIFGYHDYSIFILNSVIGLFTLLVLYYLAKSITKNKIQAFLVAFLFAISGYQIFFVRSGLAQVLTGLLLILGAMFYVKTLKIPADFSQENRKNLLWAGFFWGLMSISHYSIIAILILIFIFEIAFDIFYLKQKIAFIAKRLLYLFSPIIIFLLSAQAIYFLRNFALAKAGYPGRPMLYFEEFFYHFDSVGGTGYSFKIADLSFYLKLLRDLNGWPYLLLFLASPLVFFYKKWYQNPSLTFIFFIAWGFFSGFSIIAFKGTRNLAIIAALIGFIAALILYELFKLSRNRYYRVLIIGFFIGLLTIQLPIDWRIINLKSGYKEVARYIAENNIPTEDVYGENWPILAFYLNKKVQILDRNPRVAYYAFDWLVKSEEKKKFYYDLQRRGKIIASFDNPPAKTSAVLGENEFIVPENDFDKIIIYKVEQY